MKTIKIYYFIAILGVFIYGCDSLEPEFDRSLSDEQLWSDKDFTLAAITEAYDQLPAFYTDEFGGFLDCATDNAVTNDFNSDLVSAGIVGISELNNSINSWENAYRQIRTLNQFLEILPNIDLAIDPSLNEQVTQRSTGEAYFLRAWYQFELLSRFAGIDESGNLMGIPIVLKPLSEDELASVGRSTFDACIDQIIADIDESLTYLPENQYSSNDVVLGEQQVGRAYKLAALSLKSRVLLYAASPAYTVGKNDTEIKALWVKAARAANDAMLKIGNLPSINSNGSLYKEPNHDEIIWRSFQGDSNSPERENFMPSLWGNGRTNPSQQLVDAFPMKDGYPITKSSLYDPSNPYTSRDNRFGLSIIYNNASFGGKVAQIYVGGNDYESSSQPRATRTGYYLRKFINDNVNVVPGEDNSSEKHYYAFFRCAEIWLNFAEAANEAWGPTEDILGLGRSAEIALAELRSRAGITGNDPYLTDQANGGKESFRALVQNERRIELCFENHRFFDVRRWMLPLNVLNEGVKGVKITKNGDTNFSFEYQINVESRKFESYMYYNPLPEQVIYASQSAITQNKGW
ncbi:MAG: RagB/SusD family nutrient uptake outer membrane protein [Bacteroidales bacterium]|nr:RagB/SusD family nutrient uptake outer membrane protein [Bacteroidales bacterium]